MLVLTILHIILFEIGNIKTKVSMYKRKIEISIFNNFYQTIIVI